MTHLELPTTKRSSELDLLDMVELMTFGTSNYKFYSSINFEIPKDL